MDNAAQHFAGRTSSGLYEDRDEDATRGGCYCKPLNLPGSYEEPRSRVPVSYTHLTLPTICSV